MPVLSKHAEEQIRKRGIKAREIEMVLRYGQRTSERDGNMPTVRVRLNRIVVIVAPSVSRDYVVTAWVAGR